MAAHYNTSRTTRPLRPRTRSKHSAMDQSLYYPDRTSPAPSSEFNQVCEPSSHRSSQREDVSQTIPRRHRRWPTMSTYLVYDLSSPVFSTSELDTIFSPPSINPPLSPAPSNSSRASSSTNHTSSGDGYNGWSPLLNSRFDHITSRSPSTKPTAICIGEYTSASMAHPCSVHGIGQIFNGWNHHPSSKKFRSLIASTPVIRPSGNGPAQILKSCLDEINNRRDPLSLTWVMKFLLTPKDPANNWTLDDWYDYCDSDKIPERQFREVALLCVRRESFRDDALYRRLIEFGKLFGVEFVIVSSIA